MISKFLIAWCMVGVTVIIHSLGLAVILGLFFQLASGSRSLLRKAWQLASLVCWIIVLHMVEISLWGLFYWLNGCFENGELAFYFAGITYTTIGYGDLLLPVEWRIFAPIEGLTGILLCGLSAAVFFAAVSYLYKKNHNTD